MIGEFQRSSPRRYAAEPRELMWPLHSHPQARQNSGAPPSSNSKSPPNQTRVVPPGFYHPFGPFLYTYVHSWKTLL